MASNPPPEASLSIAELQALVRQLRQALADKEQQIAELNSQLAQVQGKDQGKQQETDSDEISEEPIPGSQEDLFAQLDKFYQER